MSKVEHRLGGFKDAGGKSQPILVFNFNKVVDLPRVYEHFFQDFQKSFQKFFFKYYPKFHQGFNYGLV